MSAVLVEEKGPVLHVTLNRPSNHNAFDSKMIQDLHETFDSVGARDHIRAVVLKGNGRSFCAGADLQWMKSMASDNQHANEVDAQKMYAMFESASQIPVPLIAKVHGHAFGGALGLIAVCDIVTAVEDTKFSFSEARIGLVPAVISPFVLKKISMSNARELMLTARRFTAAEAKEIGYLNHCGSDAEADSYLDETVDSILQNGPQCMKKIKELLQYIDVHDNDPEIIKSKTTKTIAECRVGSEGQEGMRAFFEKFTPSWRPKK